jgi:hypothetical protein
MTNLKTVQRLALVTCLIVTAANAFSTSRNTNVAFKTTGVSTSLYSKQENEESEGVTSSPSTPVASTPVVSTPVSASASTPTSMESRTTELSISDRLTAELKEASECASIAFKYVSMDASSSAISAEEIVKLCDIIDEEKSRLNDNSNSAAQFVDTIQLRKQAYELGRYHLLTKLMKKDYEAYVATAAFLSPSRIDRLDLPNVQDVPFNDIMPSMAQTINGLDGTDDNSLVDDCTLEDKKFEDSILDQVLLKIFRNIVTKNTNGITSSKDGIEGLVEQGRDYMLKPNQTAEAQHKMVSDTLGGLMTPVLPPFYRIFMSGIIPNIGGDGGERDVKQIGPWFYAPWLTTIVTPTFFGFLVGPSRPNRRKDGERGGLVVEKCKFLQVSNCKGICLHQCKLPAQQFFKEELGLELTVSPNFATQECQWSFGEKPLPPKEDPSFPNGCLVGCGSREAMAGRKIDGVTLSCS